MRTVTGLSDARSALCAGRGLGLDRVPPHVGDRIEQVFGEALAPAQVVELILERVRAHGDDAVHEFGSKLDNADLTDLEVAPSEVAHAYEAVPDDLKEALSAAAHRIRRFHETARQKSWFDFEEGYGQRFVPVQRAGVYVPGGTAIYPSTVLMAAIPAKVAGVAEVIMCTPSKEGAPPAPAVLVAADLAGVDRVFLIGGAQAVAAMAYGTQTVPRVDIVCGPGNIFVTLAKKLLFGDVGIDGLYGPTETLLIADETANPTLCAADLLAQAEHDPLATPVLITTSQELAAAVSKEILARVERLERRSIAGAAIEGQGCIAVVDTVGEAIDLANEFAPEHLTLMVRDPQSWVGKVRNAGVLFLGDFSHEVLGDYVAGPSHVMPTGGTARFSSGLGVHSFVKVSPVVALDDTTSGALAKSASLIARAEGLTAHAEAAEVREELSDAGKGEPGR